MDPRGFRRASSIDLPSPVSEDEDELIQKKPSLDFPQEGEAEIQLPSDVETLIELLSKFQFLLLTPHLVPPYLGFMFSS